jgi:hypothetical protein
MWQFILLQRLDSKMHSQISSNGGPIAAKIRIRLTLRELLHRRQVPEERCSRIGGWNHFVPEAADAIETRKSAAADLR